MTSLPSFPPQIHRKAYLAALADTRAKNIPKRSEYLSTMTTRSYTSTYYDNIPWNELGYVKKPSGKPGYDTKVPEMKKILGNNSNLYEYYPGGKKNPLRKVNNKSKARAAHWEIVRTLFSLNDKVHNFVYYIKITVPPYMVRSI